MNTAERNLIAVKLLAKVYGGAYSSIELNRELREITDERDRAYVSRLFYGVLDKSVQLDYILSKLTNKRPKPVVGVVIKTGIYMLRYMNEPSYAVVNTQTELIKKLGKRELAGFVNAVLRSSASVKIPIESRNKAFELSVNYSIPEWVTKKLIEEYGCDFTRDFIAAQLTDKTHVRVNEKEISKSTFRLLVPSAEESPCGFFVTYGELKNINPSLYVVQSLASALAVDCYVAGLPHEIKTLDLCAAPGGKAAYLAALIGADVTACDIHPHRVELIKSYAKKAGVKIKALVNDATVFSPSFESAFDLVVCDVPCSGAGVIKNKPDIMLNRKEEDVAALAELQHKIISTAGRYVKPGGTLCYSTCTVFREENEGVANAFLAENPEFEKVPAGCDKVKADEDGYVRLYPQTDGCDGFFVAKFRRKESD